MRSQELRAIQAPLKERFRSEPEAAFYTLRAEGQLAEGITCRVDTHDGVRTAGLHPATGGSGRDLCSGDMLLEALAACAGVTMNAVATAMGLEIRSGVVRAEGDLDFRGTLGVGSDVPVGFQRIRMSFHLDTDTPPEKLERLLTLTERYCVVFQTLRADLVIESRIEPGPAPLP